MELRLTKSGGGDGNLGSKSHVAARDQDAKETGVFEVWPSRHEEGLQRKGRSSIHAREQREGNRRIEKEGDDPGKLP